MTVRNVGEAKAELSALLAMVENGEEVIIARAGRPIAKLSKIERPARPRKLGLLAGKIWISSDFDEPNTNFEELFEGGPIEPAS